MVIGYWQPIQADFEAVLGWGMESTSKFAMGKISLQ
jgi:hypothetical protein